MNPDYSLRINGSPLNIDQRLVSLTLTDNRDSKADTLNITLSDHDNKLAFPPTGAVIQCAIGWKGQSLHDKGTYTVDEISHQGPPDTITISARSVDLRQDMRILKQKSWHQNTLSEIISTIASGHQLQPAIAQKYSDIAIEHIDQTDESDINFLTRLGKQYDAVATVKNGYLLFTEKGTAKTISGQAMPAITIHRKDGDRHNYSQADRSNHYTGVQAKWNDIASATQSTLTVGTNTNVKKLRAPYPTPEEALDAAQAEWNKLQRGKAKMSLTLAQGKPELATENTITLVGYKHEINRTNWLVSQISHTLSDDSLSTSVSLESLG